MYDTLEKRPNSSHQPRDYQEGAGRVIHKVKESQQDHANHVDSDQVHENAVRWE
jgi:hypothetical protein